MNNCERWRPIKGYEDEYLVSSEGRVLSLPRMVNHYSGFKRRHDGKILNPGGSKNHYLTVSLKGRTHKVHVLVAEAFLAISNKKKKEVNHIDGNKWNNNADNLEWVTRRENVNHAITNELTVFKTKCNDLQKNIINHLKLEMTPKEIGSIFSISERTVYRIFYP